MAKNNEFSGPSQRQLRVGELIKRKLADILSRGDHFEPDLEGCLITVGEVKTSTDLRVATVLVYPHGKSADVVMTALERISGRLRKQVTDGLKLRYSPELRFKLDKSFDFADETQRLIDNLPAYGEDE